MPKPRHAGTPRSVVLLVAAVWNLSAAAQNLSSVSLSPTSVTGGTSSTGTVTLSANAPTGGKVVTLSSGNTAAATVPSSVTVAAGTKTKTFTVTTVPQAVNATAVVSAAMSGVTKTATLTVKAPAASAASVSPTSVTGGTGATLTVTLTGNAPTGGTTVTLTSGNTAAATLPASVVVASGTKTATASVVTYPVSANAAVTLTAAAGGVSKTASLTVKAPAASATSVSPTSVTGGTGATLTVTLTGNAPTGGTTVTLTSGNTAAATLPPSVVVASGTKTATASVATYPVSSNAAVTLTAAAGGVSKTASLTVKAPAASGLAVSPGTVAGTAGATGTVTLTGPAPGAGTAVSLTSSLTSAATVPPSVTVSPGATTAAFAVTTLAVGARSSVTLSATAGGATKSATLLVDPPPVGVATVAFSPAAVVPGSPSTGTVTLTGASSSVSTVALASARPSDVVAPAAVEVAANETTATFPVTTTPGAAVGPVAVTASLNGSSVQGSLALVGSVAPALGIDLAEGDLSPWQGFADPPYVASVALGTALLKAGESSIRLTTDSGFDCGVRYVVPGGAHWDLRSIRFLEFWSHGEGVEPYQGEQPIVVLRGPGGSIRYQPPDTQTVNGAWRLHRVPLNDPSDWVVTSEGAPSLGDVTSFEIHQDTWGMGLTVTFDGVAFVSDIPEDLAEGTASLWRTFAEDLEPASVVDDATSLRSGSAALRFVTASGFATGLAFPRRTGVRWDLSDVRAVSFWIEPENVESFQGNQPVLVLRSPSGTLRFEPNDALVNGPGWRFYEVPLDGSPAWSRTEDGSPDLADVISIELHGDTWGYGFRWQVDGFTVGRPLPFLELPGASAPSGVPATATVLLSSVAPSGGRTVQLGSSDPAVASVPASVVVPEGSRSVSFAVTPGTVSSPTPVVLTASDRGFAVHADLRVDPAVNVAGLALVPGTAFGNQAVTGTVTIAAPAWAGGATVTLTSSNPAVVPVPAAVVVAEGATSTSFEVVPAEVLSNAVVTITANAGGESAAASLTVVPTPTIELASISTDPSFVRGGDSLPITCTLTAPAPAGGRTISLSSSAPESLSVPASLVIPPGALQATATAFAASSTPERSVVVTGTDGAIQRSAVVAVLPKASLSGLSLSAPGVFPGESVTGTITLSSEAPAGGYVVSLASSSPDVGVPGSVTVPAGATSTTFDASVAAGATGAQVTITGTAHGVSRAASFSVVALHDMTASTAACGPGVGFSLRVSVWDAVPAGRTLTVSLSSSAPTLAAVPATVAIAAGASYVVVPISPANVDADTPVDFTATATGTNRTVRVVLEPLKVRSVSQPNGRTSIASCAADTLRISLNAPAPAGGTDVDVTVSEGWTSDGTAVVGSSPPARRLTVAAGSGSVSFGVRAVFTGAPKTLVATARLGGSEASTALAVTPSTASLFAAPTNPVRGTTLELRIAFARPSDCLVDWAFDAEATSSDPAVLPIATSVRFDYYQVSTYYPFYPTLWRAFVPVPPTAAPGTTRITVSFAGTTSWVDVTVPPSAISGLSVNPTAAPGGAQVTGTATLDSPAETNGPEITLSSSDPSLVTVPASIPVPGGASVVTFPVSVVGTAAGTATVTATYRGSSRDTSVRVLSADAGRLTGKAVDASWWDHVPGMSAVLVRDGSGEVVATTAADGSFTVWREPGPTTLTLEKAGFVSRPAAPIDVPARSVTDLGAIEMEKVLAGGCLVHGRVVDVAGEPVGGATLKLVGHGLTLTTAADGTYELTGRLFDRYRFRASREGFATVVQDVPWADTLASCTPPSFLRLRDLTLPTEALPEATAFWVWPPVLEKGETATLWTRLSGAVPSWGGWATYLDLTSSIATGGNEQGPALSLSVAGSGTEFPLNRHWQMGLTNNNLTSAPVTKQHAFFYGGVTKVTALTHLPAGQTAFYVGCTPPAARSGAGTSCAVGIGSQVAPAGGLPVTLSASSTLLTVPSSVVIGAGLSSALFSVSAGAVATPTPVTITATEGTRSSTVVVELAPPALSSVAASPSRLPAGGTSVATVLLDAAAPAGGLSVALASTSADVTVPPSVPIAGGAASATFAVSVSAAAQPGLQRITATLNGRSRSTTLDVGPPRVASLSLAPASVVSGGSATGTVVLDVAAPVGGVSVSLSSSDAAVAPVPSSLLVAAGTTQATFTVTAGPVTATRTVTVTATTGSSSSAAALEVRVAPPTLTGAAPGVALPGASGIVVYGTNLGLATSVLLSGPVYPLGGTTPVCNIRGSQPPFCPETVAPATPAADGKTLTFALPPSAATGTYLLEVRAGTVASTNGVPFLVEEPSPAYDVVAPDDHNVARRIHPGQTVEGILAGSGPGCPYGATDYNQYFFFGTAGSRVDVRMERVDDSVPWSDPSSLDPQVEIVAPDGFVYGNLVRFNDRPGVDFNATLTNARLPKTGIYFIIAETARGRGAYRLSFSFSSLAPASAEDRVIPVTGNHVTGHVGDSISSWAQVLDPRGSPLTGAAVTFQQLSEPGDTGTIQFTSGADVSTSSLGVASVQATLTSYGRVRFAPHLQQTFTAPASAAPEAPALVAGAPAGESVPLYPAVALRPFTVGFFDGELLGVESSGFERLPLPTRPSRIGPFEESGPAKGRRALGAGEPAPAVGQPYGPEDEVRGEVPAARFESPGLLATTCADGLRFHSFAVQPSAQINAPLRVTLEDLTPSTGQSTPNGPVGEKGIHGHRIEKEIRLRVRVLDANGNEPDYPVLLSVSISGPAAGSVVLDPDGARIECPAATFVWHERDANGVIVAPNEVVGYRLGTFSQFLGLDREQKPVWNFTEVLQVTTFTPGQEQPSVQLFGVHPEPGKPDRLFCRDYFGQPCGDGLSYWTGQRAWQNGRKADDSPRYETSPHTLLSAYSLVDEHENELYGYFDTSVTESIPTATVEFVPHAPGDVWPDQPQAYKLRTRWSNDPAWPSGSHPVTLNVHYPADPDWPAGDVSRQMTLTFQEGTSHALAKHRTYDLIRPDGTKGVEDGSFPIRAYAGTPAAFLPKTSAQDGARLVLLAYRGEVVPGEWPELEPTETGARVWTPDGDRWRIWETRTSSFLETAGPSAFRFTLIDHGWNVIRDGEFVVHRCPRFDHSAPGAARPCDLPAVASVDGRIESLSLNPAGAAANDSRGYFGIELTRAPEGLGLYYVKVESLSRDYRLGEFTDFVTTSDEAEKPYQGAFKLVFVDDYPCPDSRCGEGECNSCTGSPNYVASGTYTTSATDIVVPTTGPPIAVSRNYLSTPGPDGVVGPGWTSSLDARVYLAPYISGGIRLGTEANVVLPSGHRYKFRLNPQTGRFDPLPGREDDLVRNADGTFDLFLERGSGAVYRFDPHGRLSSETDEYGNVVTWERDAQGRVSRIADLSGSGRWLSVGWTAGGKVHTLTDSASRTVTFDYDSDGRLAGVTDPAGRRTQYDYRRGRDSTALLTRVSDPWGRTRTDVTYDAVDRTASYTEQGVTYTYTYLDATRSRKTDASGNTTTYDFDPSSGVITTRSSADDSFQKVVDSEGRPTRVTDAAGVATGYSYDDEGRVLTVTRNAGQAGAVRYDYVYDPAFPDKVASVTPRDPATGALEPAWQGWRYEYHPVGSARPGGLKTVYRVASDGTTADAVSRYEYDAQGRVARQTTAGGAQTDYAYDASGNLQTVTGPAGTAGRPVTTYEHDALGRVTSVTDPLGKVTRYTYDSLGRVLTVTLPPTGGRTFTTTYSYDHFDAGTGFLHTEITDPNGRLTRLGYDADGRLRRSVDAAGGVTLYGYTGRHLTTITDPNGNVTTYGYDAAGRLATTSFPDGGQETYAYWNDGLLRQKTDRRGTVVGYFYDAFKRLVTKTYSTGGSVTYAYDGQKLESVTDSTVTPAETHTFGYDGRYRLASAVQAGRGTLAYTYTPDDRVETLSLSSGPTTTYAYHPDGSLQSLQWSPVAGTFTWDYTARGQYDTLTFPNGQLRDYAYDDQGRLTSLANALGASTLASYAYGYDVDPQTGQPTLLGQRTSQTATLPAQGLANAATSYGYDPLYQLIRTEYPASAPFNSEVHTWSYDSIGNRLTQGIGASVQTYTYLKSQGNPLNGQRLAGDGVDAMTYDAAGNLKTRLGPAGSFTFGYDPENRLATITGSETATYTYDYQGRRTSKTVDGVTTTYLYDGLNLVAETTNGQTTYFVNGPGIDEPLAMSKAGAVSYFSVDGLGSVVATNDPSGTVTHSVVFDAWGNVKAETGTRTHPFTYTGREVGEAGFHFYRARFYQPSIGRFIQEDPLGFKGDGPNFYLYVLNGPVLFTDPTGMRCTFSQSTGAFVCVDDRTGNEYYRGQGYSGTGDGRNNPDAQDRVSEGPLPRGLWRLDGQWYDSPNTGRNTIVLRPLDPARNPCAGTNRDCSSFRIHGNNRENDASRGCPVLPPDRTRIRLGETVEVVR